VFTVSALEAAFAIAEEMRRREMTGSIQSTIDYLQSGPATTASLDFKAGAQLVHSYGLERFLPTHDKAATTRELLARYIDLEQPFWIAAVPKGRKWLRRVLDENTVQLFAFAGLLESYPDRNIIEWWDAVAEVARMSANHSLVARGREAESYCLKLERDRLVRAGRLDLMPQWTALEDNTAGYDIKSFSIHDGGATTPLFIEVKSFSESRARFFFSRNEWRVACMHKERYQVHLVSLATLVTKIISFSELSLSIPADNGCGHWTEVEIRPEW